MLRLRHSYRRAVCNRGARLQAHEFFRWTRHPLTGQSLGRLGATANGACLLNIVSERMPVRGPVVPASGEPLSSCAVCPKSALISQPGRAVEGAGRTLSKAKKEHPMYSRFYDQEPATVGWTIGAARNVILSARRWIGSLAINDPLHEAPGLRGWGPQSLSWYHARPETQGMVS